jgi:hypothetical protein
MEAKPQQEQRDKCGTGTLSTFSIGELDNHNFAICGLSI